MAQGAHDGPIRISLETVADLHRCLKGLAAGPIYVVTGAQDPLGGCPVVSRGVAAPPPRRDLDIEVMSPTEWREHLRRIGVERTPFERHLLEQWRLRQRQAFSRRWIRPTWWERIRRRVAA